MQQPNKQTKIRDSRKEKKKKKKSIWLLQFVTAFQQSQYYLLCCLLIEASKKPQKGTSPLTYQIKMIAHSLKYCAVIPLGGILFEMGCDATILGNKENSLKPNSFLNTWSIHDRSYFMFDVCGIFSFLLFLNDKDLSMPTSTITAIHSNLHWLCHWPRAVVMYKYKKQLHKVFSTTQYHCTGSWLFLGPPWHPIKTEIPH